MKQKCTTFAKKSDAFGESHQNSEFGIVYPELIFLFFFNGRACGHDLGKAAGIKTGPTD